MLRSMLCACVAVALLACGNVALAKGKKSSKPLIGTIKSVDATSGAVTVTVKKVVTSKSTDAATDTETITKKHVTEDRDFTIDDATKISITNTDGTTKDLTGKDGLKDPVVKTGASVKVTLAAGDAVTELAVGGNYGKKKHGKHH